MTIAQLAVFAGVGPNTVERIELGHVQPYRTTLMALGAVLAEATPTPTKSEARAVNPGLRDKAEGTGRDEHDS